MIWSALKLAVWFGVAFALTTVVVVAALAGILGAVAFGILSPSRSPASSLRSLAVNASDAVAHVRQLDPRHA
jgi:hypothetical protein